MKRILSGAAILMLGLMGTAPAKADGWADAYGDSHSYSRMGNTGDRAAGGRGTGRSNLGAISSDDEGERIAQRWSSRSDRKSRRQASREERREERTSRRAARSGGGGGSHGMASYYWQPQRVASGGWFNPNAMTAAHKTLPFGTRVRVTNVNNGRSTVVTINDRGPYIAGRVIDLSRAAAGAVGMIGSGVAPIRMEVVGR